MKASENLTNDLQSVLFSKEELQTKVKEIGLKLTKDYQGKRPVLLCILKGSVLFFSDLIREINLPLEIEFMAVSSYGSGSVSSGEVKIVKDLDKSIHGKDVILVEDIVDSGMTLNFLKRTLQNRGVSSLRIVTLLDKPSRRIAPLTIDYVGFEIPDEFVVGYGLDYDESYRNLDHIGILSRHMYES